MDDVERQDVQQIDAENNTDWYIGGVGEANGDDTPDLFWRNSETGNNAIWYLNEDLEVTSQVDIESEENTDWEMVAVDDMNENGTADIIWRNPTTGQNQIWLMGGDQGTEVSETITIEEELDSSWNIGGTGDYNGDGFADLAWRNSANGNNGVWFYDGNLSRIATAGLLSETDTNWEIVHS